MRGYGVFKHLNSIQVTTPRFLRKPQKFIRPVASLRGLMVLPINVVHKFGFGISRGVLSCPHRIKLWSVKRNVVECGSSRGYGANLIPHL